MDDIQAPLELASHCRNSGVVQRGRRLLVLDNYIDSSIRREPLQLRRELGLIGLSMTSYT
jgi:hypothetical protein